MSCPSCEALRARVAELEASMKREGRVVLKKSEIPDDARHRFWMKVDMSAGDDACWPWTARSERFHITKRHAISPRRLAWLLAFDEAWPTEIAVTCHNRKCVNPLHFARTDTDKFWSFVDKNGPEVRPGLGPCWIWTGGLVKKDEVGAEKAYGAFAPRTDEIYPAHRYSYELAYGKIEGHVAHDVEHEICVLHHCDNPRCVRPDHLWLGSDRDNIHDMIAKGRHPTIGKRRSSDEKGGGS